MRATIVLGGTLFLALAFAGCTGSFQVKQTEPIRIQLDGERSQETRIAAAGAEGGGGSAEKREFVIESDDDVDVVKVIVEVKKVVVDDSSPAPTGENDTEPCEILIIVEDGDSNEKLEERRVEAGQDPAQVELNVNVKGHDNVVVVTQAVQGVADVNVAATGSQTNENDTEPSPTM